VPGCRGPYVDGRARRRAAAGAYFHIVFTLPVAIGDIAYQNKAVIYDLLFKAAAETMLTIAADPKHLGARIAITAVQHTWGSAMTHHPHVHMIVPGGGLSADGERWIATRPNFFLPVLVLSKLRSMHASSTPESCRSCCNSDNLRVVQHRINRLRKGQAPVAGKPRESPNCSWLCRAAGLTTACHRSALRPVAVDRRATRPSWACQG
jgi:hypothetical protein